MNDQAVLRLLAKLSIPFILVFGLYVIAHGELGPGGGFQGGVILGSAFILHALIFGMAIRVLIPNDAIFAEKADIVTVREIINFLIAGFFAYYAWVRGLKAAIGG